MTGEADAKRYAGVDLARYAGLLIAIATRRCSTVPGR